MSESYQDCVMARIQEALASPSGGMSIPEAEAFCRAIYPGTTVATASSTRTAIVEEIPTYWKGKAPTKEELEALTGRIISPEMQRQAEADYQRWLTEQMAREELMSPELWRPRKRTTKAGTGTSAMGLGLLIGLGALMFMGRRK